MSVHLIHSLWSFEQYLSQKLSSFQKNKIVFLNNWNIKMLIWCSLFFWGKKIVGSPKISIVLSLWGWPPSLLNSSCWSCHSLFWQRLSESHRASRMTTETYHGCRIIWTSLQGAWFPFHLLSGPSRGIVTSRKQWLLISLKLDSAFRCSQRCKRPKWLFPTPVRIAWADRI